MYSTHMLQMLVENKKERNIYMPLIYIKNQIDPFKILEVRRYPVEFPEQAPIGYNRV